MAAQEMAGIRQVLIASYGGARDIENGHIGPIDAAGRALVEVGREDFAKAAGLSVDTLALLEAGGSAWVQSQSDAEAIIRALYAFGVVVVDESGGLGAGVRLKFTRQDVKQLVRLETEGGIIRPDGSP